MRLLPVVSWAFVAGFFVALAGAAEPVAQPQAVRGEALDRSLYGPGVVESAEEMAERDRELAEQEAVTGATIRYGRWVVPSLRATYFPHSGIHNLTNKGGDPKMGIGFPVVVDVHGAYFAGQGGRGAWTTGLRVIGYRQGQAVGTTDWFRDIRDAAVWFEIGLRGVDRIVIEAEPVVDGMGWYALDDLTYTRPAGPAQTQPATVVIDFEDCAYKQQLTATGFAGLTWEEGSGGVKVEGQPMPAPVSEPEDEPGVVTEEPQASTGLRDAGTPPDLLINFIGVRYGQSLSYPPDTCGIVGPGHFVEVINGRYRVFNRDTGATMQDMGLGSFLNGGAGDPRVLYDQHSDRWIAMDTDFDDQIFLNVSMTSDPTGSWFKTNFVGAAGSDAGAWIDYPTLGVDANGVYVACTMFSTTTTQTIFAIDKAPLIAPSPSLGTVTAWRGLANHGAIQPAHTFGTPAGEYLISRASAASLTLRRIDPPLTAPTMTSWTVPIASHTSPPDVPALGSTVDLDSVGHRLMNSVYRDGSIWTAHAIGLNGRSAARWYEIDVDTQSVIQYGTVDDAVRGYIFPSIMVNRRGDAIMGFTGASSSQYATAYYTGRLSIDAPGEMAPVAALKAGQNSYTRLDEYGRNRWGDYSLCSLDPLDETTMWTIQEYAYSTANYWSTWIGELEYFRDCNSNGVDDETDITLGTSLDTNTDGIPDECQRLFVDVNASGAGDGTSWTDAFTNLQGALAKAIDPPGVVFEIWVADGSYAPAAPGGNRSTSFAIPRGVTIYGGFASGETSVDERDLVNNQSIMTGDLNGNDGPGFANNGENSYHVVTVSTNGVGDPPVIDGCVIAGGNANSAWPDNSGGGVFNEGQDVVLRGCTLRSNAAAVLGGAIFQYNLADTTVVNCVFTGNQADKGGALYMDINTATVINSSISGNHATDLAGGIYRGGGTLTVTGSVVWGNTDTSGGGQNAQIYAPVGAPAINYNCIEGLTGSFGGTGNIGTDPAFVDADGADNQFGTADDDLRLQTSSPAIDAADNTAVPAGVTIDRDGNPRFVDAPTDDTGNGTPPIVDMGAYEFQGLPPCVCQDARSAMTHGAAGRLELTMGCSNGIEPRFGGVTELEIDVDDASGFGGGVTVTCTPTAYAGAVGSSTLGNTVTLTFTPGLPNQAVCTIDLDCDASVCVRNLEGDANQDGVTNATDNSQKKGLFGQAADAGNVEWDVNADGVINATDNSQSKGRFGNSVAACP